MNYSETYTIRKEKLLNESSLIPGIYANKDYTIIRLFLNKTESKRIFSEYIFLNTDLFNQTKDHELNILTKKYATIQYKKDRFIQGLELFEDHVKNEDIDIDDIPKIAKIRNHITNTEMTTKSFGKFRETSVEVLNKILINDGEDDIDVLHSITSEKFLDPDAGDDIKGIRLVHDKDLELMDKEFDSKYRDTVTPEDSSTMTRFFYSKDDFNNHKKQSEACISEVKLLVDRKSKIIIKLLKSKYLQEITSDLIYQAQSPSPTKAIIDTITDVTKQCNVCSEETSSRYCENPECDSINPMVYFYKSEYINSYVYVASLSHPIQITNKKVDIDNFVKRNMIVSHGEKYIKILTKFIDKSDTILSINFSRISTPRQSHSTLLKTRKESKKCLSFSDHKETFGEEVVFWGHFESSGKIYAIIQNYDEIKTPSLYTLAKKAALSTDREVRVPNNNDDYYINRVIYVITDMYGQIERVREGYLDISNESKVLLSESLEPHSKKILLTRKNSGPDISGIMFVKSPTEKTLDLNKGIHLSSYLNLETISEEDILTLPKEYRFSRRFFYRLSDGYFIYEKNHSLFQMNDTSPVSFSGYGLIDRVSSIQLIDAPKFSELKKQKINMYKEFAKGMFVNPNKSSSSFYANFTKSRQSSLNKFKKSLNTEKIIDLLLQGSLYKNIIKRSFLSTPQITISTSRIASEISSRDLESYHFNDVTPFFIKELQQQSMVKDMGFKILITQSQSSTSPINDLSPNNEVFNNEMSTYIPSEVDITKDILITKQKIQNSLKALPKTIDFTVALNISLHPETSLYEKTLFIDYLEQNGIKVRVRTTDFLPVSIRSGDLIAALL